MNQELVFFENEIIRIKKEYGSRYFSKPNFHAVLKDLSPNIDEKILLVFRVADFLGLYAKFTELDTLEDDIKSIRLTELKQRFTKESAIDPNTAACVFWAYMYGNNMVLDKPSSFINIIEEQDDNTKHHVLGKILASLLLKKHNINVNIETVTIGKQVWMAKNLNIDKFRNGDPIPQAKTDEEWRRAGENKQPAWCYYDNDPANGEKYGKLYNWYAVNDSRGLAPAGWHIPLNVEWSILTDYLGGRDVAGTKMKSASGWKDGGNGTNESGFSGLPGGSRMSNGVFDLFGEGDDTAGWWSSSVFSAYLACFRELDYSNGSVGREFLNKDYGFSVRCLRDELFEKKQTSESTIEKLEYQKVTIGKQVWMAKNLNIDKFRNGALIPQAKTDSEWERADENKQPAWCYYDNDPANGEKYGKLYNWYAVNDSRGLAPAGWHIPTDKEWLNLTYYLGEREVAGAKMKSASGWKDEGNGTNESGFSGLPGGGRGNDGTFYDIGGTGCLWSSTEISSNSAWRRFLFYNFGGLSQDRFTKGNGFSVRCLRD